MDQLKPLLLVAWLAVASTPTANAQTFEPVASLPDFEGPSVAPLVKMPDGSFLGVASLHNTIFRVAPDGTGSTLVQLKEEDGVFPQSLIAASDGFYYGYTKDGGKSRDGVAFRVSATGEYEVLADFASSDARPKGGLIEGADGNFYGPSSKTFTNAGSIYRLTPSGTLSIFAEFNKDGSSGADPVGDLVEQTAGTFFGTTNSGGAHNVGVVFKVSPDGVISKLADFDNLNGARPEAGLILSAADGNFYGTTREGGASDSGTIFKITPSGVLTTLDSFDSATGSPKGRLLEVAGTLYGVTDRFGTNRVGTVFKIRPGDAEPAIVKIADFGPEVGGVPQAGLALGDDGALYGTTSDLGGLNAGTVFKVTTAGAISKVADFGAPLGSGFLEFVAGPDNKLYATTGSGGAQQKGSLLAITTEGAVSKLADFGPDFLCVLAFIDPALRPGDKLYGTIGSELVSITTSGEITPLVKLSDFGVTPAGQLMQASDGALYGMGRQGQIFRYSPEAGFEILFTIPQGTASTPIGRLVEGPDGALYGMTEMPEPPDDHEEPLVKGTVFRITKGGSFKILGVFNNDVRPFGSLVLAPDGNLYGVVNAWDRAEGTDMIFRVSVSGKVEPFAFLKKPFVDLAGSLIVGPHGDLYGYSIDAGNLNGHGIFKVSRQGVITFVKKFDDETLGGGINRQLCVGPDGNMYGGGWTNVFRLVTANESPVANDDVFELPVVQARVTANDSDPNKDPVQIISVTNGAHGTVTFTPDGTVTYSPGPDFDSAEVQSDSFTYTISDLLGGTSTATVTVSLPEDIFRAGAGNYAGVLTAGVLSKGHFNLTLTKKGAFTGTLFVDGIKTLVTGSFGPNGAYSAMIARKEPLSALTLTFQLDAISNAITGTISDGTTFYQTNLSRNLSVLSSAHPTPHRGNYTVLLANNETAESLPKGSGFARMSVTAGGAVQVTGKLGDGTPFSAGLSLSPDGSIPLYVKAYLQNKGYLAGVVTFSSSETSDASGSLTWHKPEQSKDKLYPAGFTMGPTFLATRYIKPSGFKYLGVGETASLTVADMPAKQLQHQESFIMRVVSTTGDRTNVKFDPQTGFFRGAYFNEGIRHTLEGAVYQYSELSGAGLSVDQNGTINVRITSLVNP